MSYMSTSEEHEDDDDELPSYESCLSEFTAEAASGNPGELLGLDTTVSESSAQPPASFAPVLPSPHPQAQIAGPPPIIPTGTKPINSAGHPVPNPDSPLYDHGPPPIRRETRPDTFSDTSPTAISASALYYHYDNLLVDGLSHPSDTLCRLAGALFTQLTLSEFLDPLALARASDPSIRNVVFTPRMLFRLTRFLTISGVPFTRTASNIPVLTRSSFIQWLVFEMRANPDYSYTTWKTRLENYSLYDPHTNTTFIGPIPRTAFPAQPVDAVLTNVHDVWRAIVHVLGKRQGKFNGTSTPAPVAGGTHFRPHNVAATPGRVRGRGKWAFRGSGGREDTLPAAAERKLIRGFERGTVRGVARGIFRGLF